RSRLLPRWPSVSCEAVLAGEPLCLDVHQSSRIATSRLRSVPLILCSLATRRSAACASGAYAKSMNVAGVFLMSDTRQRTKRSRGFDFLALAMRHHQLSAPSQCLDYLGFGHLAVLVANVADFLSVDWPDGQRVILERDEQGFELIIRCGYFTQPLRPFLFGDNDRHPVVERADQRTGRASDDGAALDPLPGLLV